MPAKNLKRVDKEKACYHVYNRGIASSTIFNDEEDYETFLGYLKEYLTPPAKSEDIKKSFVVKGRTFKGVPHRPKNYFDKIKLIAYHLAPDHFHLVLYQTNKGALEKLMRSLCTRYSMYFNKKYQRTGALLEGPYKSALIKDSPSLVLLTHYLHRGSRGDKGDYSSYPEYLGARETAWVKTEPVLSHLKSDSKPFRGFKDYKGFVERYGPTQEEQKLIKTIGIEKDFDHLKKEAPVAEKPILEKKAFEEEPLPRTQLKPLQRLPELALASITLGILFAFGLININVADGKIQGPSLSPERQVAKEAPEQTPEQVVEEAAEEVKEPETSGQVAGQETEKVTEIEAVPTQIPETPKPIKTKAMVIVQIEDEAAFVNIRQGPTTDSQKIGKTKDGDTFELISEGLNWYEVRLDNDSTGFISADYMEKL